MTTPTVESLAALGRRLWITTLLWVVGRTLCRAARIDEAVRRELVKLGVADGQVEAVSFGKEKPAATGTDETAWSQNRRAEITYR